MSSFDIVVEVRNALLSAGGITDVYDSLVTPDRVSSVVSPYACIGEFRKIQGRVMDASEQKCFIDVFLWTKYKGKKQCMELADKLETALADLARTYYFEESYFDYDDESGWSLAMITLRTYQE